MKSLTITEVKQQGNVLHLGYGDVGMVVDPGADWEGYLTRVFNEDCFIALLMGATKGQNLTGRTLTFDLNAPDGAIVRLS